MAIRSAASGRSGVHYMVDTRTSQFTVQAFASGLIAAIAHSPKIAIRELDWRSPNGFRQARESLPLRFGVKTSSLEVLDELPDLIAGSSIGVMNNEVLETDQSSRRLRYDSTEISVEKLKEDLIPPQRDVEG